MKQRLFIRATFFSLRSFVGCTTAGRSEEQKVIDFPEGAVLQVLDATPLATERARKDADRFSKLILIEYFGAFAASDTGVFGRIAGYHRLADAKAAALKKYREWAQAIDATDAKNLHHSYDSFAARL